MAMVAHCALLAAGGMVGSGSGMSPMHDPWAVTGTRPAQGPTPQPHGWGGLLKLAARIVSAWRRWKTDGARGKGGKT